MVDPLKLHTAECSHGAMATFQVKPLVNKHIVHGQTYKKMVKSVRVKGKTKAADTMEPNPASSIS